MPTRRDFLLTTAALAATAAAPPTRPPPPTTRTGLPGIDPRNTTEYFRTRIAHITDQDLFDALDLSLPQLAAVKRAADAHDYPAAYQAWADYWPTVSSRVLFYDPNDFLLPKEKLLPTLEPDRATIIAQADRVLTHDFPGWGDATVPQGPVIDFNADYGNSGKYGFHYWGWSRPLTRAFLLTHDQKYLKEFDDDFNAWYDQRDHVRGNIPDLDVLYYELGLGIRNRHFLEYYALPYANRPLKTHEHLLKTCLGAARWLLPVEQQSYRPGNWQIFASFGLAHLGLMLPEFQDAAAWVNVGAGRVLEHRQKDFHNDGGFTERCPSSYALIAYRDPRNLAVLLNQTPAYQSLTPRLTRPLEKTLDWYLALLPPDATLPAINDGSRNPIPPGMLQDGYDLFHRSDMLWVKQNLLLTPPQLHVGSASADAVPSSSLTSDLRPLTSPPTSQSSTLHPPPSLVSHLPDSGFTSVRSSWSKDALYLLINHGADGGGHAHASALDFNFYANGRPLAVDSGIGKTYDDPLHQSWYVTSPAHNMLTADADSVPPRGAPGENLTFSTGPHLDYLAASHQGYSHKGLLIRRHYLLVARTYLVTADVITPTKPKSDPTAPKLLQWHLHCPLPDMQLPPGVIFTSRHLLVAPATNNWTASLSKAMASVADIPGYPSPYSPIPWLRYSSPTPTEPTTFAVLLFPKTDPQITATLHTESSTPTATHLIVKTPTHTDHLLLGNVTTDNLTFQGAAALLRYQNNTLQRWQLVHSTRLTLNGNDLHTTPTPQDAHS